MCNIVSFLLAFVCNTSFVHRPALSNRYLQSVLLRAKWYLTKSGVLAVLTIMLPWLVTVSSVGTTVTSFLCNCKVFYNFMIYIVLQITTIAFALLQRRFVSSFTGWNVDGSAWLCCSLELSCVPKPCFQSIDFIWRPWGKYFSYRSRRSVKSPVLHLSTREHRINYRPFDSSYCCPFFVSS